MTRRKANRGRTTPKQRRSPNRAAANQPTKRLPTSANPRPSVTAGNATDNTASTDDSLIPLIGKALDDHPFALLSLASVMIVEIIEAAPEDPEIEVTTVRGIELLSAGMIESKEPEQIAFGLVLAALSLDKDMPGRVQERVGSVDAFPAWVSQLDAAQPALPWSMNHILGDDQNLFFGVSFGEGLDATAVVYVDHLLGSAVKEVTLTPEPIGQVVQRFVDSMDADEASFDELDPADARATLVAAIEASLALPVEHQTENWPRFRPLVAWLASLLPEDGTVQSQTTTPDSSVEDVVDEFLLAEGQQFTPSQQGFTELLVDFKTRTGNRSAMLWSPVSVDVVLSHSMVGQAQNLDDNYEQLPDVLRNLIRWSHQQASVPERLTASTLDAVDEFEDLFLSSIAELVLSNGPPWANDDTESP